MAENELLSVSEWAKLHDREVSSVRRMLISGRLKGFKVGNQWVIPANTELPPDGRIKSGQYIDWRKPKEE